MSASKLYTATKSRLAGYGVFDEAAIDKVAGFAAKQAEYVTYQDFFTAMGIGDAFLHTALSGSGVPVIDVPACTEEKGVLVIHAPMEMPLNEAQLYLIATLAGVFPEYRIIGFGNPSGDRFYYKQQSLTFWQRLGMLITNNQRALVAAELDYLQSQGINKTYQVGFSYGALKAVLESEYLPTDSVEGVILIDPVAKPRSIFKLARDFAKTYGPLGKYVNQVGLKTYHEARGVAAKGRDHQRALWRPINIVIGLLLARVNIFKRLQKVLTHVQPQARATVAWGTASELGDDEYAQRSLAAFGTGASAVQQIRLEGLEHAFANDVHLYAAVVGQRLQP